MEAGAAPLRSDRRTGSSRLSPPVFAQIRARRLLADFHGASEDSSSTGGSVAGEDQALNQSPMTARRQQQWEAQLKEKAFLTATIKPIVDETVAHKPPIPYALRQVQRSA